MATTPQLNSLIVADQRCQLNAKNRKGETPLHIASELGDLGTIKVLICTKECDLNFSDEKGNTPLHTACNHGHNCTVELLVAEQRCHLNTQNREGKTPLHIASEYSYMHTVKALLSCKDCDPNICDKKGNAPLHTACRHAHHSTDDEMRYQLNNQDREDEFSHCIASALALEYIKHCVILEDCVCCILDRNSNTALHTACKHGHHSTVEFLVADQRCQLDTKNSELNTALHIACHTKELSIIKLLLDMKCSTNIPNTKGETAEYIPLNENGDCLLHIACQWGDAAIVRHLIVDQQCNPNIANASGNTPLHIACKHGHIGVVKVLMSCKDCDPNISDAKGNTPLHTACKHVNHSTVVSFVSDNVFAAQESKGKISLCGVYDDEPLISFKDCDLHTCDLYGNTKFHAADNDNHHSTIKILVADQRCQLDTTHSELNTALLIACHTK